MVSDLDMIRRMFRESESIFAFSQDLCDEEDNLPSRELQDMLAVMIDGIIEFRCALESATYEGLDHFDQEGGE
jgi:hypothetical protein